MKLKYIAHLEDFYLPEVNAEEAAEARKEILKTLSSFKLKVPAATMTDKQLAALPGHVLFGWRYDRDLSLSFYAIPESKLKPPLAEAMSTATNSTFTNFELSTHQNAAAFACIDAAMRDKTLAKYRIAYFEDGEEPKIEAKAFDKRFVSAYAVRRSQ